MFKNKTFIFWAIAAIVMMVGVAFSFGGKVNTTQVAPNAKTVSEPAATTTASVDASGLLAAQSAASLMWQTSGTVGKVNVKVGEHVSAGDVLVELQPGSAPANTIAAQADLVKAKQALDDVLKSNLPAAKAQKELSDAQKAQDDAQKAFDRLNRPRVSDELIEQTADELESAQNRLKFITKIYNKFFGYSNMDKDRIAKSELTLKLNQMQENLNSLTAKYNWYTSAPSAVSIAQAQAALNAANSRVENAQREFDRLKGGSSGDIASARARVTAAQATVNMLYGIAPFDGEVLVIEQNPGDVVSTGTKALLIADRSQLHVNAQVAETEIALVKVGQTAIVTLDSIPGKVFTGRVTQIDTVGATVAGLIKYSVRIDLDPMDGSESMLLGGTADVTIQVK